MFEIYPSGFKVSNVKEQCEYLQKTIKSEFATYGGNYNGITYSQFLKADTRTAAIVLRVFMNAAKIMQMKILSEQITLKRHIINFINKDMRSFLRERPFCCMTGISDALW